MNSKGPYVSIAVVAMTILLVSAESGWATSHDDRNSPITFTDIAANDGAGITYRRRPSERFAIIEGYQDRGGFSAAELPMSPLKSRGAPGVVLFDYDNDDDLDIYVTNGPEESNSLYQNQLSQTGVVEFLDVANAAGVSAKDIDATGACAGDLDNDGDKDLLVLAFNAQHRLFENQGGGLFHDISSAADLNFEQGAMSCAMGDVNADGLLDIAIANISNLENVLAFAVEPFLYNIHNQLFINQGHNLFHDASETSGVRSLAQVPAGAATMTWAVTIVDMDLDGDQDIVFADDQAGMPNTQQGGVDRGYIQLLDNDGSGQFTARAISGTGEWMGLAISDLNCDGHLDVFSSNFGDYGLTATNPNYALGDSASRWLLGTESAAFLDPGVGEMIATPFGWGTSVLDYDNDADPDLIFHGGMDVITMVEASNGGALLRNDGCSGKFIRDGEALANGTDHTRRAVQGTAVGDLNNDGFVDIVSVSNVDIPIDAPLLSYSAQYDSVFDNDALFVPLFAPVDPQTFVWTGQTLDDGTLSVEINSADNNNGWVAIDVLGGIGLTQDGMVNRDGIGAVVSFKPRAMATNMKPVLGGSSYASQDSLTSHFGLGRAHHGVVDIFWPGGVKNRIYRVRSGERLLVPEIPCGIDDYDMSRRAYRRCVSSALLDYVHEGVLSRRQAGRFFVSAMVARYDNRHRENH